MIRPPASRAALALLCVLLHAPLVLRADSLPDRPGRVPGSRPAWKINTHLFAANIAIQDALNDGNVTIPPFGEIPVARAALRALQAYPATYRAGVLAPDLFPDMYVGGWFIHSDLEATEKWIADNWMRHVWSRGRAWSDPEQKDRVMAFTYGFLTHAAGDMFAHTYVSEKADGAWVTGIKSTALKHIVLEGYVGSRTPPTDLTLDVWPRYVSNTLIRDPVVRRHTRGAKHYRRWLEIYDWLGPKIEKAKEQMNNNVDDDAPYWMKCGINPDACLRKEQMESWRLDITRGLRALVESSQTLGEKIMDHKTTEGVGAMTDWATEWVPKMFGAHAVGEGVAAMREFLEWIGDPLAPINEAIMEEVKRFMKEEFPTYYQLYQAVQDPAYQMDHVGFPAGTKSVVNQDLHLQSSGLLSWREFEPLYNSVILSKLVLLDGDGLNELARRAGMTAQLFRPGEGTNVLLGVVRSMTQSFQWMGETLDAKDTATGVTKHGICGPEHRDTLPHRALCGVKQRDYSDKRGPVRQRDPIARSATGGFALWGHPEAREKIFRVIFKGYGLGPGRSIPQDVIAAVRLPGREVRPASRTLGAIAEQVERMHEVVGVMRGKIGGVVPPTTLAAERQPARLPSSPRVRGRQAPGSASPTTRTPVAAAQVGNITDWGRRCCARDLAELRAALQAIGTLAPRLRDSRLLATLRRPGASQLGTRAAAVSRAVDAFENTRDAQSAGRELANISSGVTALRKMVNQR